MWNETNKPWMSACMWECALCISVCLVWLIHFSNTIWRFGNGTETRMKTVIFFHNHQHHHHLYLHLSIYFIYTTLVYRLYTLHASGMVGNDITQNRRESASQCVPRNWAPKSKNICVNSMARWTHTALRIHHYLLSWREERKMDTDWRWKKTKRTKKNHANVEKCMEIISKTLRVEKWSVLINKYKSIV